MQGKGELGRDKQRKSPEQMSALLKIVWAAP